MEILLQELYKNDIHLDRYHFRKVYIDSGSYQINGISQSGKTSLVKNHLLELKKSSYLYVDCNDTRLDIQRLNTSLTKFCNQNKIEVLALDNYNPNIKIPNVSQLIICSQVHYELDFLQSITLYPLDYEEFLAYEHKYDSGALNHFVGLGGLPSMHKVHSDEKNLYVQKTLQTTLTPIEFDILVFCARMMAQKLSAFSIYERLKQGRKISKDKLYSSFTSLDDKNYIHQLQKYNHPKAIKKVYLCDTSLKSALTIEKNFAKLFENMIYLELLKAGAEAFYDDGVDFYLPSSDEIVLGMAFSDERMLFKKLEQIEAFLFGYNIKKVTAVTMNTEGEVGHPIAKVEMLPFDIWALGD